MLNLLNLTSSGNRSRVLGVDIGQESLQYVVIQRKAGGRPTVENFGRYAYKGAQDPVEGLYEVVPILCKKNGHLKGTKLIIGIEETMAVVKTESLPGLPDKELRQTVAFAFEKDLASGEEGNPVVCSNYSLGPDPEKKDNNLHLLVGMFEEEVHQIVQPFTDQGLVPVKVVIKMMALGNLAVMLPQGNTNTPIGILNIGSTKSMLAIFRQGKLDFHREIVMGDNDFTKAIIGTIFHEGKAIQFSMDEAVEFKNKFGYPLGFVDSMSFKGAPLSELGAMMRPVVERLTGEIQRSIGFYGDKTKGDSVATLYLIGKGSKIKHLDQVLNSRVGIPVSRIPLPRQINIAGGKKQKTAFKQKFLDHTISLSVGLESDVKGSLLPDSYRIRHLQANINKWGRMVFLAMVLLTVLWGTSKILKVNVLQGQIREAERIALEAETAERRYAKAVTQSNLLRDEITGIHKRIQQDEDLVQILRLFSHKLPKKLLISTFEYTWETKKIAAAPAPARKAKKTRPDDEPAETVQTVRKLVFEGGSSAPDADVKINVADFLLALQESGYFETMDLTDELLEDASEKQDAIYWFQAEGILKE